MVKNRSKGVQVEKNKRNEDDDEVKIVEKSEFVRCTRSRRLKAIDAFYEQQPNTRTSKKRSRTPRWKILSAEHNTEMESEKHEASEFKGYSKRQKSKPGTNRGNDTFGSEIKSAQVAMESLRGINHQIDECDEQGHYKGRKAQEDGETEKFGSKRLSKNAVSDGGDSVAEENREDEQDNGSIKHSAEEAREKLQTMNQQIDEWDQEVRCKGTKRRGRKSNREAKENGAIEKIRSKKRSKNAVENAGDSVALENREHKDNGSKKHNVEEEEKVEATDFPKYSTHPTKIVQDNAAVLENASNPRNRKRKDENGNKIVSNMCHQCQRNDKGRVVRCTRCKTKRFCVPCMTRWY